MRVVLSEYKPDYGSYVFPYHVWGFLDDGESPADALAAGFLPAAYDMSRFYLTRSVRIALDAFSDTSRTRYVRRRCGHLTGTLVERADFRLTDPLRELAVAYFASQRRAPEYRRKRFFEMISSPFATHFMRFTDETNSQPVGLVPLFLTGNVADYGIPVYDPAYRDISIGNHMMADTLREMRDRERAYVYLGTCYSPGDRYKTRFAGMQFFNGYRWSDDRRELHVLMDHQARDEPAHVLGAPDYLDEFCAGDVAALPERSALRLTSGP